jgi:hypothetical protein
MEETSSFQERATQPPCISTLTRRLEHSRAGNIKTDPLISNHQVDQPISKSGAPTLNGGKPSSTKVRTLLIQEARSLMLLLELIMRIKTSLLLQETTK